MMMMAATARSRIESRQEAEPHPESRGSGRASGALGRGKPLHLTHGTPPRAGERNQREPILGPRWIPWIFAAKTAASGLLALLIAFTFNLDQPKWTLLTVFIVAQPQSGLVLAKSFYRIIGTFVGAAVALLLVSLFAQERVLFLGSLAVWLGVCTYASRYARSFAAYGFALSGYSVAIIGISGALDPGNAFFIAVARVTEISLGIMITATISHIILPVSLAQSLRRTVATARGQVADYAVAVLRGASTARALRTQLLGQVIAIEKLRAAAVFEDRDIRNRNDLLQRLDVAMLGVIDVAQFVERSLEWLRQYPPTVLSSLERSLAQAATAIELWRNGSLDPAGLKRYLVLASGHLPLDSEFYRAAQPQDDMVIQHVACYGRLHEFLAAFGALTEAYEDFLSPNPRKAGPQTRFSTSTDRSAAIWAGLRSAMSLILLSAFWILADWPSGVTAVILGAVVTVRLATMENVVPAATASTAAIVLQMLPFFVIVEVLLPQVSGFPMFALIVGPVLLFFAFLMAHEKTAGLGFISALYFSHAAGFVDRMGYDPVGFINMSIAVAVAIGSGAVLFAVVAPETPESARRQFAQAVRAAFDRIRQRSGQIRLTEFQTRLAEALDGLRRVLRAERGEDLAAIEAGMALMGVGRELIRVRDDGRSTPANDAVAEDVFRFATRPGRKQLARAQQAAENAARICLSELKGGALSVREARIAAREMVAFATIRDELDRGSQLLLNGRARGGQANAA
jgi:uncharacterized membrane protein YccC